MSVLALLLTLTATGCSGVPVAPPQQAQAAPPSVLETTRGLASYYARMLHGRLTASGIKLDLEQMVAAHPSYPFGTLVRVTNLVNDQTVDVSIVDRGPAKGPRADGVIIDLSRAAARRLELFEDGRAAVLLEVLKWGEARSASPSAD